MPDIERAVTSRRGFIAGSLSGAGLMLVDADVQAAPGDNRFQTPIFKDRFERDQPATWGKPWFNQRYEHDWSVGNGYGRYPMPAPVRGAHFFPNPILVLDHDVRNIEIFSTLQISDQSARGGLLGRASSYFDFITAYLDGTSLVLARCDYHDVKVLDRRANALNPSLLFNMRLRIEGSTPTRARAKIWSVGHPEPPWQVSARTSHAAVQGPGAFGLVAHHSSEKMPTYIASSEFFAYSPNEPKPSPAKLVYSLAGPPDADSIVRLVAKASIPATIGFEFGPDPDFNGATTVEMAATAPELIASTNVDTSSLAAGSMVHWRAYVVRQGIRKNGPASAFRKPPALASPMRFAFGSCATWAPKVRESFATAASKNIDFFIQQGDFGYARGGAAARQADSYQDFWFRVLGDPAMRQLSRKAPVSLLRDDSEYGTDRADRNSLLPFVVEAHEKIHANPSNDFHSVSYGGVSVFNLDCRRYSTGATLPETGRTRLGVEQTQWLKTAMQAAADAGAGLLVVSSPVAFGSPKRQEAWYTTYPTEWQDLMSFFSSLDAPVLIVSGNSHVHKTIETPANAEPSTPRIVEFISSGTEQTGWPVVEQQDIEGKRIKADAFGLVEVGAEQVTDGRETRTVSLRCLKSGDGTEWFRSEYLAVKGVGLEGTS